MLATLEEPVIDVNNELLPQEKVFVEAYVRLNNATKAGIEAGYSPQTAAQTANRCLKRPRVAKAIDERRQEIARELGYTPEKLKAKLIGVIESGKSDSDRIRAIELLGKSQGMWQEKSETSTFNLFNILPTLPTRSSTHSTTRITSLSSSDAVNAHLVGPSEGRVAPPQPPLLDSNTTSNKNVMQNQTSLQVQHDIEYTI